MTSRMKVKYLNHSSAQPRPDRATSGQCNHVDHADLAKESSSPSFPNSSKQSFNLKLVLVGPTYRLQPPHDLFMTAEEVAQIESVVRECAARNAIQPHADHLLNTNEHVQIKDDIRIKNDDVEEEEYHRHDIGTRFPGSPPRELHAEAPDLDLGDEDGDNEEDDGDDDNVEGDDDLDDDDDFDDNNDHTCGGGHDKGDTNDDDHAVGIRATASAPGEFLDSAVNLTTISYVDLDKVFNIIFSRLGPLPQNPCSSILSLLLSRIESRQRKDFPFATKHKGAVPPAWWPVWLLPYGSPVRMRTEDKKKAIAFIFMMPHYCQQTTKEKTDEQNFSDWQELLQTTLQKAVLTTGYPKRKNALDDDNFDEKRDNTTDSELADRRSLIDVLLKIAADVEWIANGQLDRNTVRSMPPTPDSLRRMMYGKGRGRRKRRATNTTKSGKRSHAATVSPPPSPSAANSESHAAELRSLTQKRPRVLDFLDDGSADRRRASPPRSPKKDAITIFADCNDDVPEVPTDVDEPADEDLSRPVRSPATDSLATTVAPYQVTLNGTQNQTVSTSTSFSSILSDAASSTAAQALSFQCSERQQTPPSAKTSPVALNADPELAKVNFMHNSADGMRGLFVPEALPTAMFSQQPMLQNGGFYCDQGPVLQVSPATDIDMESSAGPSSPRHMDSNGMWASQTGPNQGPPWPYPDQKVYYEPRSSAMVSDMPFEFGGEGYQNGYWRPYTDHFYGCGCCRCDQKHDDA